MESSQADMSQPSSSVVAKQLAQLDRSSRSGVLFWVLNAVNWLILSVLFAIVYSMKLHYPDFLANCRWLTTGKVYLLHMNSLVYGWAIPSAIAILVWILVRSAGVELSQSAKRLFFLGGGLWNLGVTLGLLGIAMGFGTGFHLMEFPLFVWAILGMAYLSVVLACLGQLSVSSQNIKHFSSYLLLGFLLLGVVIGVGYRAAFHLELGSVMLAASNQWYQSALLYLVLIPISVGGLFYLIPKITHQSLFSHCLAKLALILFIVLAPWAGYHRMLGVPIPVFIVPLSSTALVLLGIPLVLIVWNCFETLRPKLSKISPSPALRFFSLALVAMGILAILPLSLVTPEKLKLTQFTVANYGHQILVLLGVFGCVFFGVVYFMIPRLTGREWASRRLISRHYWLTLYGLLIILTCTLMGGFFQGVAQLNWLAPWRSTGGVLSPWMIGTTIGWIIVLVGQISFSLNLGLMVLRLGIIDEQPTLLVEDHHQALPVHGNESFLGDEEG